MRYQPCEYQPGLEKEPPGPEAIAYGSWIDRGILFLALLAGTLAMSRNLADPDLWGHVQYGRDALRHGLPTTTTYSYIAAGYPWINHEIVAEVVMALGADAFGAIGLLTAKTLLALALLSGILWRARSRGVGIIPCTMVILLVGLALGDHWTVRPQLFSYAATAILFATLDWAFSGWGDHWWLPTWRFRSDSSEYDAAADAEYVAFDYSLDRLRYLWLLPILFLVWTNAHGGFLAGLCVYIAYLSFRSVEAWFQLGWEAWGLVKRFALMVAVAILSTFLNPYSFHFHEWLYDDLKVPRPEILEWRAPDFTDPLSWPIGILAVLAIVAILFTRKSRDFTQFAILGLLIWQMLEHARHGAFLAIAVGFWLPPHIESLLERLDIGREKYFGAGLLPFWRSAFVGGLMAFSLLVGTQLVVRLQEMPVERNTYPVSAVEFLAKEKLEGKIVCTFNWAQYLLAALGAEDKHTTGLQVHVDGRCRTSFSQQMLDEHFDFILGDVGPQQRFRCPDSGPYDPARVLTSGSPDLVLLCRLQPVSEQTMIAHKKDWVLLYQDPLAQVWGRRDRYANAHSPHYLPAKRRQITDTPQVGSVNWPALRSAASLAATWHNQQRGSAMLRDDLSNVPARPIPSALNARASCKAQATTKRPAAKAQRQALAPYVLPRWLLVATLLMVCALPLSNNITDPDLWGHVQYGLDVLQDGLQYTATYTYSAEGARWISHENLAELLFALGMTTLGPTAVLLLKTALGVALIGWMFARAQRQQVGMMSATLVFPLVAMNLMHFWNIRPQTLSFLLFTLVIVLLEWCFTGWSGNWNLPWLRTLFAGDDPPQPALRPGRLHYLWLLPVLMAIWTNTHGAFLAGCCVITAYLAGRSWELWCQHKSAAWPTIRYLALLLIATLLSTLINPLGWDLHWELYGRLAVPRPEIIEWQPPEFWSIVWLQFWLLLALAGAAVLFARRPRDFTQLVIFLLVAWQAVEHRRHIAFVALLFGLWFPPLVESLFRRLKNKSERDPAEELFLPPALRWPVFGGLTAVCLFAGALLADQLQILPVRKDRYPVAAFQFIRDHRLDRQGRFVCQFEWAQYAIMAFGQRTADEPGLRMQFDGRFRELYPQEVLDMYWDFDFGPTAPLGRYRSPHSPPISPHRVLSHLQPDLVLMSRERPQAIAVLESNADEWVLLYQDGLASLWGRRTRYDRPASPDYLPPHQRRISDTPQQGIVAWPALPALPTTRTADSQQLTGSQTHARRDS